MEYSYIIQDKNPLRELLFGGFIYTMGIFIFPLITLYGYYIDSMFRIVDGKNTPPKWNIFNHFKLGLIPSIITAVFAIGFVGIVGIITAVSPAFVVIPISIYVLLIYITPAFLTSRHRTDTSIIQLVLRRKYTSGAFISLFTIMGSTVGGFIFLGATYSYFVEMLSVSDSIVIQALFLLLLVIIPTYAILTVVSILTHIGIVMWGGKIHEIINNL